MWTLAAWASGAGGATGKGAGAIVGVIDSGLDITHPAFLRADGTTRILRLWDQTFMYANGVPVTRTGDPFAPESIPRDENGGMALQARAPSAVDPDFDYGIQFNSDQINTALDRWRSGTAPPGSLQDENGHGTHVTGIAAGNGRARDTGNGVYVGVAPEADIIFVKTGISGRSGPDVSDIGQAARYIAGAAAAAAPGKPCVINISLGIHDTPHNGHDPEIRAIAELLGANDKVAVVIAASNERDDNLHATLSVTPGSRQTLNHRLRRDRRTLRFFVSYNAGATVKVAVRAPDGASTGELRVDGQERGFAGDHTVEVTKYEQLDGDPDRHFTILIDCDSRASIRLGLWDFTFIAEGGIRANIHMWRSSAQERKWGEFEPGRRLELPRRRMPSARMRSAAEGVPRTGFGQRSAPTRHARRRSLSQHSIRTRPRTNWRDFRRRAQHPTTFRSASTTRRPPFPNPISPGRASGSMPRCLAWARRTAARSRATRSRAAPAWPLPTSQERSH